MPFATFPLYPPRADVGANIVEPPVSAKSDLTHRTKTTCYSITSSARASKVGGTSRPSALAVLRLRTVSYLVGCTTGRLATFSPLRMRLSGFRAMQKSVQCASVRVHLGNLG